MRGRRDLPTAVRDYEPIHTFSGNQGRPAARLLQAPDGRLYGTTVAGGQHGKGSVFVTDVAGLDAQVLHEFNGFDGEAPVSELLFASDGNFYGTTSAGGPSGFGTVFQMTPDGGVTTVVAFDDANGAHPSGGLIEVNGTLYGTTASGGSGSGTVFSLALDGVHSVIPLDGIVGASPRGRLLHDPAVTRYSVPQNPVVQMMPALSSRSDPTARRSWHSRRSIRCSTAAGRATGLSKRPTATSMARRRGTVSMISARCSSSRLAATSRRSSLSTWRTGRRRLAA